MDAILLKLNNRWLNRSNEDTANVLQRFLKMKKINPISLEFFTEEFRIIREDKFLLRIKYLN